MNVVLTPATIAKLELGPNDIVIVRSTVALAPEQVEYVFDAVTEAIGRDHKVLILAPNISIEVLEKP